MSLSPSNRRHMLALALAVPAGAALAASPASAYQGNMEHALSKLFDALGSLREASSNKGGHRVNAMRLIQQAITEVQNGIEFADERGGG